MSDPFHGLLAIGALAWKEGLRNQIQVALVSAIITATLLLWLPGLIGHDKANEVSHAELHAGQVEMAKRVDEIAGSGTQISRDNATANRVQTEQIDRLKVDVIELRSRLALVERMQTEVLTTLKLKGAK